MNKNTSEHIFEIPISRMRRSAFLKMFIQQGHLKINEMWIIKNRQVIHYTPKTFRKRYRYLVRHIVSGLSLKVNSRVVGCYVTKKLNTSTVRFVNTATGKYYEIKVVFDKNAYERIIGKCSGSNPYNIEEV